MTQLISWLLSARSDKRKMKHRNNSKPESTKREAWEMSAKDALHVKTLGSGRKV